MTPQRTTDATADAPELPVLLAAAEEPTVDLPLEHTADIAAPENVTLDAIDSAAPEVKASQQVTVTPTGNSNSKHEFDTMRAGRPAIDQAPLAPMPQQRALGFVAFAVCAVVAILMTIQQARQPSVPESNALLAAAPPSRESQPIQAGTSTTSTHESEQTSKPPEARPEPIVESKRKSVDPSLGVVAFQSRSFVTSEQAITAVFILKRTQVVRGNAAVQWTARSGSADAGIDFSDVSGTARFADGQKQVAIYVPLRNDLLKEKDESFKVCLRGPRQARIGGRSCAEVTILDDDHITPT